MKKNYWMVIALLMSFISLMSLDIMTKTLPNGMNVVVKKNTSNQSVGIFCFVHTGSIYEGRFLGSGISHYLEHVVSGGSTSLHSEEYYSTTEKEIGAVSNAYTTSDVTAFHMTVNNEKFTPALQMLAEHVQLCSFDSLEVAREQKVIAKEIVMRATPPYSRMFQRYNEIAQSKANDRYPVIGYVDQFLKLKRTDLIEYYNKRFVPNNMTFVVSGNIDVEKTMLEIENVFSSYPRRAIEPVYLPVQPVIIGTLEHKEEFDINLPYVIINQIIPVNDFKDYYALQATIDILFSKYSSPLQKKLYEDLQLVNYITAYTDIDRNTNSGKLTIMFEAKETDKMQEIINILFQELAKYKKGYFTQEQLNTLFHRYEAEHLLKPRTVEDECNEIGDDMRQYGVPDNHLFFMQNMRNVHPQDLNLMIQKYFNPSGKLSFYAIPLGQSEQLKLSSTKESIVSDLIKDEQMKGITLIHKQNSNLPIVRGSINIPVSSDYETEKNVNYISFMANMLFRGSKKYSMEKIIDWTENKAATVRVSSNREGLEISFSCLTSDLKEMQNILIDAIKNPVFDEHEIMMYKEELNADLQRSLSDPETVHSDYRSKMIYQSKREAMDSVEKNEVIQKITRQELIETYNKYFRADKAIFSIVGDQTLSEAKIFSQTVFNAFNHQSIDDEINSLQFTVKNQNYINHYMFEQVNLDINMKAPTVTDPDYVVIKVISSILNGSNGRIHKATRGRNDLSYFAYAGEMSGKRYGIYRVTSQTSKEKAEELKTVLLAELDKMMYEKVSPEEISSAVEENNKQLNLYMTDEYIGSYAVYYESLGLGFDYMSSGIEQFRAVTPDDVQRVAQKYFKDRDVIISVPSDDLKRMLDVKE